MKGDLKEPAVQKAANMLQVLFRTHAPKHTVATPTQVREDRERKTNPQAPSRHFGNRWRDSPWFSRDISTKDAGKVALEAWEAHLRGDYALGLVPVDGGGGCYWGAIDIDVKNFNGGMERDIFWLKALAPEKTLQVVHPLPFRSTSGGVHLFVFSEERTSTKIMRSILNDLKTAIGLDIDIEIFPKQTIIEPGKTGNYINLPLFAAFSDSMVPTESFNPFNAPGFRRPIFHRVLYTPIEEKYENSILNHLQNGLDYSEQGEGNVLTYESKLGSSPKPIDGGIGSFKVPESSGMSEVENPASSSKQPSLDSKGVKLPEGLKKSLNKASRLVTKEILDKVFSKAENKSIVEGYNGLRNLKEGSRHDVILSLCGYVAAVDPTLQGVVELLNSMTRDPFPNNDSTLKGLITVFDNYREKRWAEMKKSGVKGGDNKPLKRKVKAVLSPGDNGGLLLCDFFDENVPEDFVTPEVLSVEEIIQTKKVRITVRWKPEPGNPYWDEEGVDKEKGYVDTTLEFQGYSELCSFRSAKKVFQDHFSLDLSVNSKEWPGFLSFIRHYPGMYKFVNDTHDLFVSYAASSFVRIIKHMKYSAMSSDILEKGNRFLTKQTFNEVNHYIFKSLFSSKLGNGALVEFSTACLGSSEDKAANDLKRFLLMDSKNKSALKKSFIEILKSLGFENKRLTFKNGMKDGSQGQSRCWVISESALNPFGMIQNETLVEDEEGNKRPPDRFSSEEELQAYKDAHCTPNPGSIYPHSYSDPDDPDDPDEKEEEEEIF